MKPVDWSSLFGQGAERIQASTIRELLKLTQRPGILSFAGGLPAPELFPKEEAAEAAAKLLRERGEVALQYGPTEGYAPLRAFVGAWLGVDPEEVLITTGSQQALDLLGKVFLEEGSPVLLEAPSYLGAIQAFRAYGPRFLTVPTGEEGPDLEALREALLRERPRFLYLIPSFQNPASGLMPLAKRQKLLELVTEAGVVVVEDDAYRELYFGERRLPSLFELARSAGYEGVIYLSSFSKILAPGLRVAFAVAPKEALKKLVQAKQGVDLHTPTLNQMLVLELLKEGLPARLERVRRVYREKAQAMLEALDSAMPQGVRYTRPQGGMFVWMELPEGVSSEELFQKAIAEGVAFVPGGPFFANGGGENTLRLSYATMDRARIQEGVKRLARALESLLPLKAR
ncbi:transcriptional regulator with HTH domain and aminotransferase domain [Thermus oshimai JL-2]|uniref:Transcriptional regulator with HTH domain and aminotransferase domain n=1 Tax=Thermus oshimai JL-2 TaxID=751945 RepID=K7R495_THEOS|nr:2-aminoadipate transaminase [Thermus oshimai]AFV75729.1 transcriptional regulator with HTH domain and aminotransferase domain [Thermus oshimai JL-2]